MPGEAFKRQHASNLSGPLNSVERSGHSSGSSRLSRSPLVQAVDVRPEGLPGLPFGLGELVQSIRIADVGQVSIDFPVLEDLRDSYPHSAPPSVHDRAPRYQLGLEPVEGLAAQFGPRGFGGCGIVFAFPATGQGQGAGGVIAVLGTAIIAELSGRPSMLPHRVSWRPRTGPVCSRDLRTRCLPPGSLVCPDP